MTAGRARHGLFGLNRRRLSVIVAVCLTASLVPAAPARAATADFELRHHPSNTGSFTLYLDDPDVATEVQEIPVHLSSDVDPVGFTVVLRKIGGVGSEHRGWVESVDFSPLRSRRLYPYAIAVREGGSVTATYADASGANGQPEILARSTVWYQHPQQPRENELIFSDLPPRGSRVDGSAGAAAPGALLRVYASLAGGEPVATTTAAGDGSFVAPLPLGTDRGAVYVTSEVGGRPESAPTHVPFAGVIVAIEGPSGEFVRSNLETQLATEPRGCAEIEARQQSCSYVGDLTRSDGLISVHPQFLPTTGRYLLHAFPWPNPLGEPPGHPVDYVVGGPTVDAGTITVLPPNFAGTVVDGGGRPVREARLWAFEQREPWRLKCCIEELADPAGDAAMWMRDGTWDVYAYSPLGCLLVESEHVTVQVDDGVASPSTATFTLQFPEDAAPTSPDAVEDLVPVTEAPVEIALPLPGGEILATFEGVTEGGSVRASCASHLVDETLQPIDPPLHLATAAVFERVSLCVPYRNLLGTAAVDEAGLRLWQEVDGSLTDVTTAVDTSHDVVCGASDQLGTFAVAPATGPPPPVEEQVVRVAGANRIATAAAISAAAFAPPVEVAFLATARDYADALSGGAAAGSLRGPVLLTEPDHLPAETTSELQRLQPSRIIILGGTTAISESVESAAAAHAPEVVRVGGADRIETSAAVADALFSPGVDVAYVATARGFADALVGGVAAALGEGPVLVTEPTHLSAPIRDALARLRPQRVVLLGGESALSAEVEDAIAAEGFSVERLNGADRFSTAAAIATTVFPDGAEHVFIATGAGFADALAAVPAAAASGAPLLLVERDGLPDATTSTLQRLGVRSATVLGGAATVSDEVVRQLAELLATSAP